MTIEKLPADKSIPYEIYMQLCMQRQEHHVLNKENNILQKDIGLTLYPASV